MYGSEDFVYSDEELELLRKNTKLDIFSLIRLSRRKKLFDKFYSLYNDTSPNRNNTLFNESPELLEYDIRLKKWINSCMSSWEHYIDVENDRFGLDEFAKKALYNTRFDIKMKMKRK